MFFLYKNIYILGSEDYKYYSLGLHCTTCQIAFEFSEEHRAHYKSDWHRYNLKQKIRNRQTINEPKFFALKSIIHFYLFDLTIFINIY